MLLFLVFMFNQINAALVNIKYFFQEVNILYVSNQAVLLHTK